MSGLVLHDGPLKVDTPPGIYRCSRWQGNKEYSELIIVPKRVGPWMHSRVGWLMHKVRWAQFKPERDEGIGRWYAHAICGVSFHAPIFCTEPDPDATICRRCIGERPVPWDRTKARMALRCSTDPRQVMGAAS